MSETHLKKKKKKNSELFISNGSMLAIINLETCCALFT